MSRDLQIAIDRGIETPLWVQVRCGIKEMIDSQLLRPGVPMPSSRRLAADLSVARSVVVEAYQQLSAEGYLDTADRSGTRVAQLAALNASAAATDVAPIPEVDTTKWDLRTGLADVTGFPRNEWLVCLQHVLASATPEDFEYPLPTGTPAVRQELSAYVGRTRAVRSDPADVMVTLGFAQGLALICETLLDLGHASVGIEDPGHPGQRRFIEGTGMKTVAVRVDMEGLDVKHLIETGTRAVLVTPAHQFPTGVALSPQRRIELAQWAQQVDGLVIEDDYDGEFWFYAGDRPPAVQQLAPDHVVYAGSASKTLAPGLRLGWMMTPPKLTPLIACSRGRRDLGASSIDQLAYAHFIMTGRLERHLRRMRRRYRERLQVLTEVFASRMPEAQVRGSAAGLHCYVDLPERYSEQAVVHAAAQRGVVVRGGAHFTVDRVLPPGLVIGYATYAPGVLAEALNTLIDACQAV